MSNFGTEDLYLESPPCTSLVLLFQLTQHPQMQMQLQILFAVASAFEDVRLGRHKVFCSWTST